MGPVRLWNFLTGLRSMLVSSWSILHWPKNTERILQSCCHILYMYMMPTLVLVQVQLHCISNTTNWYVPRLCIVYLYFVHVIIYVYIDEVRYASDLRHRLSIDEVSSQGTWKESSNVDTPEFDESLVDAGGVSSITASDADTHCKKVLCSLHEDCAHVM